jgi:hypothetical protein
LRFGEAGKKVALTNGTPHLVVTRRPLDVVAPALGRTPVVVDPFCGVGTVLAVANAHGLDALGVEKHRKRAEQARALVVRPEPEPTSAG